MLGRGVGGFGFILISRKWVSTCFLRWYIVKGGSLTEVVERVKNCQNWVDGATFWVLCVHPGDHEGGLW